MGPHVCEFLHTLGFTRRALGTGKTCPTDSARLGSATAAGDCNGTPKGCEQAVQYLLKQFQLNDITTITLCLAESLPILKFPKINK